jgi:hypothetical protein
MSYYCSKCFFLLGLITEKLLLKKPHKASKNINYKLFTTPSIITEEQKEFYLDEINSLEILSKTEHNRY